jgi:RNA polymerase subunit RPABC4/transcription elongation factor Spt4
MSGSERQPIKIYCRRCGAVIDLGALCPNCPRPSLLAAWAAFLLPSQEEKRRLAVCGAMLAVLAACLYLLQIRSRHFSSGLMFGSLAAELMSALMFIPISISLMLGISRLFRVVSVVTAVMLAAAAVLLALDEALARLWS